MNVCFRNDATSARWLWLLAMAGICLFGSPHYASLRADDPPIAEGAWVSATASRLPGREVPQNEWGHLKGRVLVEGTLEPIAKINPDKDREYCLANGHEIVNELIVVGSDHGLRDVYVMLYLARGDTPPPVHPSYEELKKKPVVLDNKLCRFEPHAAFVRTGQTLTMRNGDEIGHNIHTLNVDEKNKNVPSGGSVDVTYEQVDKIPADVECNIHPFMKGLLLVRDDPYAAITNEKGEFLIENLPAGQWKFQFWHKKVGYLSMLTRDGQTFLERRGEFSLEIKAGETIDLGDLTLAAAVLNKKD